MNPDDISVNLLPQILQELSEVFGLAATMILVEKRGGVGLYVPKGELSDSHDLIKLLGREDAEKLQATYAGEELEIPLAIRAMKAVRNAEIKAKRQHRSTSSLAREYRTTERNIRYICNELEDDKQDALF